MCEVSFCEGAINTFLKDKIKENEYCSKVIETKFNKPLVMINKDHEDLR